MADSSIKRSVEVLQADVDLNGDNAWASAEPAGDLESGDEICAGRWAREDALGLGGPAGHGERICLWNCHDLVEILGA